MAMTRTASTDTGRGMEKAPGLRIGTKLILTFLLFILTMGGALAVVYQRYVPELILTQIQLRTSAIAQQMGAAVLDPLAVRNYLRVNKITEFTAKLPDIAYAAVINSKGVPVAGIFGNLELFDAEFVKTVKADGFPKEVTAQNKLLPGSPASTKELRVGGKSVYEVAVPLGETGAEVHVAIFTDVVKEAVQQSLFPLIITLAIVGLVGIIAMFVVARTVSRPIRQLTEQAHQVSLGELSQDVVVEAGGEIWELAHSFQRMQVAIRYAADQLKRSRQGPSR